MRDSDERLSESASTNRQQLTELTGLVDRFDTAMVTTLADDGELHARPMAITGRDDPLCSLYFLSARQAPKIDEISADPRALVTMQGTASFVALSGRLVADTATPAAIGDMLQPKWAVWFSEPGESDACSPSLLSFRIDSAEYWDRTGVNRWRILWQTQLARLRRQRLHDDELPGHGRLQSFDGKPS